MSEGARPKLGCSVEPANDFSGAQQGHRGIELLLTGILHGIASFSIIENVFDLGTRVARPPVDGTHFRLRSGGARFVHFLVPDPSSGTQRATRISGSRRHKNVADSKFLLQR